tara:strand:+ start:116 stop:367 length:252 start_codon:yes stop_codon:yes gene_type:complete
MRKRNYILTLVDYGYKVEAWDDYDNYVCVYEKTREAASEFIMNWWEMSERNKNSVMTTGKAMLEMIELDKKYGINRGNKDGLD